MGFCRYCGEIVSGTRCKCGGTPIAPVVSWEQTNPSQQKKDRWVNSYISNKPAPSAVNSSDQTRSQSPTKSFPRPLSSRFNSATSTSGLGSRVSMHIESSTLQHPSTKQPQKNPSPKPEHDVIPSLSPSSSLAKVYGSVLQPKESLQKHSCFHCSTQFPPDATLYPDPNNTDPSTPRFVCRACFAQNGGSKGTCAKCNRPVLMLKREPYIQAAGSYWHKACFTCGGCGLNISAFPTVDLLGKPCCNTCFDSCLKRDKTPTRGNSKSFSSNTGGFVPDISSNKSREASPTIDELEQRLGISKSPRSPLGGIATPPSTPPISPERFRASPVRSNSAVSVADVGSLHSSVLEQKMTSPLSTPKKPVYTYPASDPHSPSRSHIGSEKTDPSALAECTNDPVKVGKQPSKHFPVPRTTFLTENPSILNATKQTSPEDAVLNSVPSDPNACPGCRKRVFAMERGVVPGPQGSRWHANCLICGGSKAHDARGRAYTGKNKEPGCGKKLDSGAKYDGNGSAWCRECSLLQNENQPARGVQSRNIFAPISSGMVTSSIGTTTLARQFTGMSTNETLLLRQMTGGGLSPTRSLSPTKQLGAIKPRPKSLMVERSRTGMALIREG